MRRAIEAHLGRNRSRASSMARSSAWRSSSLSRPIHRAREWWRAPCSPPRSRSGWRSSTARSSAPRRATAGASGANRWDTSSRRRCGRLRHRLSRGLLPPRRRGRARARHRVHGRQVVRARPHQLLRVHRRPARRSGPLALAPPGSGGRRHRRRADRVQGPASIEPWPRPPPAQTITSADAVQSRSRAGSRRLPADACTPRRPRSPRSPRRGGRHEPPHPCGSTAGGAR